MSIIWIWFGIIKIGFGLSIEAYFLYKLSINMDNFFAIKEYIAFNLNYTYNIKYISNTSINEILFYLTIKNYLEIIVFISLRLLILLKFHFNKNINSIFILLVVLILIPTLTYSAYTYGDLYAHINNYVNIYIN